MKHLVLYILMMLTFSINTSAQSVVIKQGNTFVQVKKSTTKNPPKKTEYTYKASDGKIYPIYLSSKGKVFIIKTSKKTGKQYRQYLSEVTKQLSAK